MLNILPVIQQKVLFLLLYNIAVKHYNFPGQITVYNSPLKLLPQHEIRTGLHQATSPSTFSETGDKSEG